MQEMAILTKIPYKNNFPPFFVSLALSTTVLVSVDLLVAVRGNGIRHTP